MSTRKVIILYGSQTGTAQDIAEQIWRNSKMYYLQGNLMPMDDYDVKRLIDEQFAIFVVSTTGQGEEPDNMVKFWKFLLRKNLPTDSLCDLNFAVLGLGDSRYPKFNFVAKKLHKRLAQLGGSQLQPVGCCDEQHDLGYNAVYMPWINNVWNRICEISPIPAGLQKLTETPRQFRWGVEIVEENLIDLDDYEPFSDWHLEQSVETKVIQNKRITPNDHFQDVRMVSFKKTNIMSWSPGDIIYIRSRNLMENVDKLFQLFDEHNLGFTRNTTIEIKEIDSEMHVPVHLQHKITLENLAIHYWDLNAIPRARTFELLALNCKNDLEKEKLQEFCSIDGQEDLYSYANRPRRTMIEVLIDFPHATGALEINTLFELFQPIKPRPFSIASSEKSGQLDLLVAVVEYKTKLSTPRRGLCSNWLKTLTVDNKVSFSIRRGTFKLPLDKNIPLIMVGPGTGLAAFRSILQEREMSGENGGPLVLFFGCRFKNSDFHCKEDLLRMEQSGLLKLFCAFSRDQENKVYVQHLIRKESELLKDLIVNQNGHIYVSGSSKNMPQDVMEAFIEAIGDANLIEEMKKCEKYQEETWQ